jgi:hypothetical protein
VGRARVRRAQQTGMQQAAAKQGELGHVPHCASDGGWAIADVAAQKGEQQQQQAAGMRK